ncbi:DUF6331 family protein [Sinirhodobacter huangdaonensis]|uniref:Uncharacterized protein n=1 Tax=Paenirhodobacter huangdaonensis TaxID=2501515 RepID=A0A443LLJ9_9RHOB|nr:DUF6331 family protein [Sinirhodobacter huangdaonensis]RWR50077.1 hypothetical protein EOW66_16350 [Sinirhodobacter huangdaonensis]
MNRIPQLPAAHPQNHLEALAKYCATMCEIECCGLDACDFSPVHIASYCLSRDVRYPSRVAMEIIEQAKTLKKNYGSNGASARGITIDEINERMTGRRVDILAEILVRQAALAKAILDTDQADERDPVFVWQNGRGSNALNED